MEVDEFDRINREMPKDCRVYILNGDTVIQDQVGCYFRKRVRYSLLASWEDPVFYIQQVHPRLDVVFHLTPNASTEQAVFQLNEV